MKITPYEWQEPLIEAATTSLRKNQTFISAFPTGSGKTVIALETARRLGGPWLVIAPKISISAWWRTAEQMGVDNLLDVLNPEQLVKKSGCKWYHNDEQIMWRIPAGTSVIWDEPHRGASGPNSKMTLALARLKAFAKYIHPMSATVADSPLKLRAIGWLCDLHNFSRSSFYSWALQHGCYFDRHGGISFTGNPKQAVKHMEKIREDLGDRILALRVEEIPNFPEETIDFIYMDLSDRDRKEVEKVLEEMSSRMKSSAKSQLADVLRQRERLEFHMTSSLAQAAFERITEGASTVNFFSFTEPRLRFESLLKERLSKARINPKICSIHGGQKSEDRKELLDLFQTNQIYAAAVQLQAGGASVNLHDELHQRPRVSFILPAYEAADVKQALGRIRRCRGTRATQYFVIAANTIQERVVRSLRKKLTCIDTLNDTDFNL